MSQTSTMWCCVKTTSAFSKSMAPTTMILVLTCVVLSTMLDLPQQRLESECRVSCTSLYELFFFLLLLFLSYPCTFPIPAFGWGRGQVGGGRGVCGIVQLNKFFCFCALLVFFVCFFFKSKWYWIPCSLFTLFRPASTVYGELELYKWMNKVSVNEFIRKGLDGRDR